jgi:RNA polymerase sigma-70 factor, ECF subfamily
VAAIAQDEFTRMVEPYRRELHAHCYRMLASVHDADDALQDALLRAWRGIGRFEGRSSLRAWLYRIATNASLDVIARRPRRTLPMERGPEADPYGGDGEPLLESVWVEPYPDDQLGYEQREGVELAFIAALQHLPATQRAVLILREVLGFSAREVAEQLDTTVAAVNSALQRARAAVAQRTPERTQQATLQAVGDDEIRALVQRYVDAWDRGDVDAVVTMLAQDATFSMPPLTAWFRGREAIRAFLPTGPLSIPRRFLPTTANGQLAFGTYRWVAEESRYVPNAVHVVTLRGAEIADATAFLMPELFPRFGLPMSPGGGAGLKGHELPPSPSPDPAGGRAARR